MASALKAVVLGASGQLGAALTGVLEREGAEVVGTRMAQGREGLVALDLRDGPAVARLVERERPGVVFLAVNVRGGVDRCEDEPDETRALIVDGTRHVVDAARRLDGARLVYFSTDYVFDGKAGPYAENAPASPINAYGRAKLEAEKIALSLPGALIVRTTALFGWDRSSKNFAMQVWERLGAGQAMRVPEDQWCNPTPVDFLAEATARLVQEGKTGVYNVVGRERVTRVDFARALAKTMALDAKLIEPVPTARLGQRAPRPLQAGLTTEKLSRALGTEPWSLADSLERFRRKWRADTHVKAGPASGGPQADALRGEILERVRRYYELVHKPKPFVPLKSRVGYAGRVFGPEEMEALAGSALDFWLTMGPCGDLFESKLKAFFGARDFLAVNSGSTANLTAVMTLMSAQLERPLRAGDEVITPAVTFPTTMAPIVHGGMIPVVVDCEVGTYNIDPRRLEDAVSDKTRAIFVPHTLGNPCDMDVIVELAERRGLYLIEDACDALGSTFRGKLVGTFGDLGTLSFYPAHHITMGEGGGVIVNRARLSRIARSVRDWGRDCWCAPGESNTCGRRFGWELGGLPKGYDHKYTYSNLGYNFKPTDMQTAVGAAQADRIGEFTAARKRNFKRLYEGLAPYRDRLILPTLDPRSDPSWFAFPITVREGTSRAALVARLEAANIETRQIFGGNILKQPGYQGVRARVVGTLDGTDAVMRDSFFIGVYPGLTDPMIDYVLETFAGFFK